MRCQCRLLEDTLLQNAIAALDEYRRFTGISIDPSGFDEPADVMAETIATAAM